MKPRTLALIVIAFAVALIGLGHCVGRRSAESVARVKLAAAEERAASAAGALTVQRVRMEKLAVDAADLRIELDRVRAAVPSVTVREVVRWRTAPMTAGGALPYTSPGAGPASDFESGHTDPGSPDAARVPAPDGAGVSCLVPVGAQLDVRVTEARLKSDSGAQALIGRAEVWRLDPPPETRVAEGPFDARLSEWKRAEDAPRAVARPLPRWSLAADYGPGAVAAGLERRLVGGLWAGAVAGVVRGEAYIAGRVRLEWGK